MVKKVLVSLMVLFGVSSVDLAAGSFGDSLGAGVLSNVITDVAGPKGVIYERRSRPVYVDRGGYSSGADVRRVTEKYEDEIRDMKRRYDKRIREMRKDYDEEIERLNKRNKKEMDKLNKRMRKLEKKSRGKKYEDN